MAHTLPEGMKPEALKKRLRDESRRFGFDHIGFAPAVLPEAGRRFAAWLEAGHHGEMGWLGRNPARRSDAGAGRTVIVCSVNYWAGGPATAPPGGGVVSQYAAGDDYHRVLESRLRAFARFAGELGRKAGLLGEDERIPTLVDHGPLLEKAFAERAGIGWIGKHSNVIAPRGSSWFFLGELLFPAALPPDDPHPNRCGTCSRCIAACPTDAIVAPYVVDSRLCISYLTIELRGPIPRELRRKMGDRIFGCDDCQDVCPWNRFAVKAADSELAPRADGLGTETLADLLALTRDEFQRRTRRSAIRRAGYPGFLRNVVVALGNTRDPAAFPPLGRALDHPEPLVRGHAAWALGEVDASRATPLLRARLRRETDDSVREEITATLDERAMVNSPKTMVKTAN